MHNLISRRGFARWLGAPVAAACAQWPLASVASEFKKIEMVRVVLGVPAGSMVDNIARQVAQIIREDYAVNAMVENKTGAGGSLALGYFKTLPKDGSSIYVGVSSPITVYPVTYKTLPYDPDKDLVPVGSLGGFDLALAVGPMVPASVKDLKGYFEWCRQNPEKANFGSPGAGSMPHFVGSMTANVAGVELSHVAYRGPGPAVLDLQGGMVSAVVVPLVDLTELATQGRIRILGTTGEVRSRAVPQVPTFKEQGFGEYAKSVWIAVFAPAGMPEAALTRLRENLQRNLAKPEVRDAMGRQLQEVKWGGPEQLKAQITQERASWQKAVQTLKFTPES